MNYALEPMLVRDKDLTAMARIRNAALEGFALNGVAATSIRDVANAADVSAGLVQHHFKTKAALRQAVNEYVIQVGGEALEGLDGSAVQGDLLKEIGDRITRLVRDHHFALLYVIRSAAEGDEAGLEIFDAFLGVATEQVKQLTKEGLLRDDVDQLWASLHVIILNLGTVLLEPAISRHLGGSLRDPAQLERWNLASTELFRHGLFPSRGASKSS